MVWKSVFLIMVLGTLIGCGDIKTNDQMNNKVNFEVMLSIPWGTNSPNALKPKVEEQNIIGDSTLRQSHKVYAPVLFKVDHQLGYHILNSDTVEGDRIIRYSKNGTLLNSLIVHLTKLAKEHQILDFVFDNDSNYYILDRVIPGKDTNKYLLRFYKLDSKGNILWRREGDFNRKPIDFTLIEGEFHKIMVDEKSNCFLISNADPSAIGQYDGTNGAYIRTLSFENESNQVFSTGFDRFFRVIDLKDKKTKGLSEFDIQTRKANDFIADKVLHANLLYVFGVDDHLNCYEYDFPEIRKISLSKSQVTTFGITGMAVTNSKEPAVYVSATGENNDITIEAYANNEKRQEWQLAIPKRVTNRFASGFKLIGVDKKQRFYIRIHKPIKNSETVLVFSKEGEFIEEMVPETWVKMESRIQNHRFWQVDHHGAIYLPLSTPEGFHLVRMHM